MRLLALLFIFVGIMGCAIPKYPRGQIPEFFDIELLSKEPKDLEKLLSKGPEDSEEQKDSEQYLKKLLRVYLRETYFRSLPYLVIHWKEDGVKQALIYKNKVLGKTETVDNAPYIWVVLFDDSVNKTSRTVIHRFFSPPARSGRSVIQGIVALLVRRGVSGFPADKESDIQEETRKIRWQKIKLTSETGDPVYVGSVGFTLKPNTVNEIAVKRTKDVEMKHTSSITETNTKKGASFHIEKKEETSFKIDLTRTTETKKTSTLTKDTSLTQGSPHFYFGNFESYGVGAGIAVGGVWTNLDECEKKKVKDNFPLIKAYALMYIDYPFSRPGWDLVNGSREPRSTT